VAMLGLISWEREVGVSQFLRSGIGKTEGGDDSIMAFKAVATCSYSSVEL